MKRARDIRDQLEGLLERVEIELTSNHGDLDSIKKAITSSFFHNSARLQKIGTYHTLKNPQTIHIHPSSGLAQVLQRRVVYHQLVLTTKKYMHQVKELKPELLVEIAPNYCRLNFLARIAMEVQSESKWKQLWCLQYVLISTRNRLQGLLVYVVRL